MNRNIYKEITDKIIEGLKQGFIPWKKTWTTYTHCNIISLKPYNGVNILLLNLACWNKGYQSNLWVTYNQAKTLGGNVKKGEKGTNIVYFQLIEKKNNGEVKNEGDKKEYFPLLRTYSVFNLEQCENINLNKTKVSPRIKIEEIVEAETIIEGYKDRPEIIREMVDIPHYNYETDIIRVPNSFNNANSYYSVLFHEIIHSTGHTSRLNRNFRKDESKEEYSEEELVAEIGSCFLSSKAGIEDVETEKNSIAYIQGWIKVFENNERILVTASSKARKAVDYVLGVKESDTKETE